MKLIQTELKNLIPNEYNPNSMSEEKMAQLKKTIKKSGYWQFIIARPAENFDANNPLYKIIDGEHRWLAMKDEPEFQDPQYVVLVESDEDTAKIQTINFNHLRGEMDSTKMANILHDLIERNGFEEVEAMIGMGEEELKNYNEMADFDFNHYNKVSDDDTTDLEDDQEEEGTEITFELSAEELSQYNALRTILPEIMQDASDKEVFMFLVVNAIKAGVSTLEPMEEKPLEDEPGEGLINKAE